MSIQFTVQKFPASGTLKDEAGLPFSCVVQPFAKVTTAPLDKVSQVNSKEIGRCSDCFSYANKHCSFERNGWSCGLCGAYNEYRSYKNGRYSRPAARTSCPELRHDCIEVLCDFSDQLFGDDEEDAEAPLLIYAQPVFIALVDTCCGEDFLELVKSGLLAALEALPPAAVFGLVTFSDKVGLYDVQGQVPAVRYVPCKESTEDSPTYLELEEALPLSALLAPLATAKDAITSALDTLTPQGSKTEGAAGSKAGRRAFGGALQAVLRYLGGAGADAASQECQRSGRAASTSAPATAAYAGARLLTFLSGPPNHGRGRIHRPKEPEMRAEYQNPAIFDPTFPDVNPYTFSVAPSAKPPEEQNGFSLETRGAEEEEWEMDPGAQRFYTEAAGAAATLGVCVDLFMVSGEEVGLQHMDLLASSSGGAMYLYPGLEEAALPQDIYRRLSCPHALGGVLRLRTSPEYRVARCYGRLFPDEQHENLQHIISCDPHDSFALDFEFTSFGGFEASPGCKPALQLVFQYSLLVPDRESGDPPRYVLQRRLRIHTLILDIARSPEELYAHADADAIACLLMHKVARATEEEGVEEGRVLLRDWLILLTANYNRHMRGSSRRASSKQVDVAFEGAEALQPIPRLAYALLRSPLLAGGSSPAGARTDALTCLRLLWSSLPADELARAVYPVLMSFSDPETQAFPRHSLSRAGLITSGAPIFLMDTYDMLIIYYVAGYPANLPFPPPQQSLLRRIVNSRKQARRLTPQVKMMRGGIDNVDLFTEHLIEEPDAGAAGEAAAAGFVTFLDGVAKEVQQLLEEMED